MPLNTPEAIAAAEAAYDATRLSRPNIATLVDACLPADRDGLAEQLQAMEPATVAKLAEPWNDIIDALLDAKPEAPAENTDAVIAVLKAIDGGEDEPLSDDEREIIDMLLKVLPSGGE